MIDLYPPPKLEKVPPEKKPTRSWVWWVLVVLLLAAVLIVSWLLFGNGSTPVAVVLTGLIGMAPDSGV